MAGIKARSATRAAQLAAEAAQQVAEPIVPPSDGAAPGPIAGKVDHRRGFSWVDYAEYNRLRVAQATAHRAAAKTVQAAEQKARAAERRLQAEGKYQTAKPRVVTITDGTQFLTFNSEAARVRRAQKRVFSWAEALPKSTQKVKRDNKTIDLGPRMVMLTLTYGPDERWERRDITSFLRRVRRKLDKKLLGYAWVAEMQERGEVHYHVLLYCKRGTAIPKPDEAGWWTKGSTNIKTAKTAHYICKYVGKEKQKEGLPKGARMYAVWINKDVITDAERLGFRLSALPTWFAKVIAENAPAIGPTLRWARAPGGGWFIKDTGERFASPWAIVAIDDFVLPGFAVSRAEFAQLRGEAVQAPSVTA